LRLTRQRDGSARRTGLELELSGRAPWRLLERGTEWILEPKSELLKLLSGVRGLPLKEAKILSEEHKAVLLVVIGYGRKRGSLQSKMGEILRLDAPRYSKRMFEKSSTDIDHRGVMPITIDTEKLYDTDLTDAAWALIAPMLPAARPGGRPRTTNIRAVLNAIFYLLRTGCHWRLLPREFPASGPGRTAVSGLASSA